MVAKTIYQNRKRAIGYNELEGINGYQQYDIHIHDLLSVLIAIEFKTINSQKIMNGYVGNTYDDGLANTGGSDEVESSSGALKIGNCPFKYRGLENLWGNVWSFVDGVNIDQVNGTKDTIYTIRNARYYLSNKITKYHDKVTTYTKFNTNGYGLDFGFDEATPYINLPTKNGGTAGFANEDYYYQNTNSEYKIMLVGGDLAYNAASGLNSIYLHWNNEYGDYTVASRLVKTPLQD